ncbi:hypothetical protein [Vannielia litorea]|uniref:Lipoprotein n=1 Tax=Vannielia litorea TaxID=1217970 RepID=A0A1N6GS93_9RHOB|nr:hypothetical protein [Vannielia litorea]SIO10424.1 hypothetical protein SAMN05444002_2736 [Vannielia litorea]
MVIMLRRALAAALLALAGCGPAIEVGQSFDPGEVAYIKRPGAASVTGQAFFRQRGGGVVTCAGYDVVLAPAGGYAKEFVTRAFGSVQGGAIPVVMMPKVQHPAAFSEFQRKATCDAEGDFEFRAVPDGDYYIFSGILWEVPNQIIPEGGALAEFFRVSGGRSVRVIVN